MKKISIVFLSLFILTACVNSNKVEKEVDGAVESKEVEKQEENEKIVVNVDEEPEIEKEEVELEEKEESPKAEKEELKENKPEVAFDQDAFIRNTFAEHGYQVPDKSQWIVKEEGNNKVAVIIKENTRGKGKPIISKLIFLRNGNNPEILHLLVKNKNII